MPRPRLLQAPLLAASRPPSSRSCAATSAKRAHSSAKKNRNREKPEPEYRGPHPLDIILGEKKGGEFLDPRTTTRAHARFLGVQRCKNHKKEKPRRESMMLTTCACSFRVRNTERCTALKASVNREIFCM